jgi:catechol 2,3-dioxygenase-like lactoylglutathione lyase family enzyme
VELKLTKDSLDIGIVTNDAEPMLAFYRDLVGLVSAGEGKVPGGVSYRLRCGTATVKLLALRKPLPARSPAGGIYASTGCRYWTFSVPSVIQTVAACEAAGVPVAVPVTEYEPGRTMAIVEDPDGNWVEFIDERTG